MIEAPAPEAAALRMGPRAYLEVKEGAGQH